jgi:hypothetical protein
MAAIPALTMVLARRIPRATARLSAVAVVPLVVLAQAGSGALFLIHPIVATTGAAVMWVAVGMVGMGAVMRVAGETVGMGAVTVVVMVGINLKFSI